MKGDYARIFAVVKRIPRGRVATYGQVAALAGLVNHARQVGYALAGCEDRSVPWQRVVNASGGISPRPHPYAVLEQRALLEREGVKFDANGRIALSRFRWKAEPRRPR